MKLIFIENESSITPLLASANYRMGEDVVVCLNYLAVIRLRKAGPAHRCVFCEELLGAEDYVALNDASDAIAMGWRRVGGEDRTQFDGISFGDLAKGIPSRLYHAGVLLKYGELLRQAVARWPDCRSISHDLSGTGISVHQWLDDDGYAFDKRRLVEAVAGQLSLSVECIEPPEPLRAAFVAYRFSKNAPKLGMRRHLRNSLALVRRLAESALNACSGLIRFVRPVGKRVYLFHYLNNQAGLINRLDSRFVLRSLPHMRPGRWLLSGVSFLDFNRERYTASPEEAVFRKQLASLVESAKTDSAWRALFVFRGIDYLPALLPILDRLISEHLPQLLDYVAKIRHGLRRARIGVLVLNDTLDEQNQAVVAACQREGVLSVFVDHGIMGLSHGVHACDRAEPSIIISPGSFDPYRHRAPTVALGNPSMDAYAAHRGRNITKLRRILFLTFEDNFYARFDRFAHQERYYEEIFSIFPALLDSGFEILYKPHPGESRAYHDYLFQFFGVPAHRVEVVQHRSFIDVIREVDLVVSNVTSCFYEAQAAGVPTVFMEPAFNPDALCPPLNGTPWRDVLRASRGDELLQLILAHREDPAPLLEFLNRFLQEQAPLYMGPIDGSASARILDYVMALNISPQQGNEPARRSA